MKTNFLKNIWYMAGWAYELDNDVIARTIIDTPLLVARDNDGEVFALHDRCAHRFAPLSLGKLVEQGIQCGYHGLIFNTEGQCVGNPLGKDHVPPGCKVNSFPVSLQDEIIWVWLGEPEKANPDTIPRFHCFSDASLKFVFGITDVAANYQLMTDNLLDLTHAVYLHPGFGGAIPDKVNLSVKDETVYSSYTVENVPNSDFGQEVFPTDGENIDTWDDIRWVPPAVHYLESGTKRTGSSKESGFVIPALHILTPVSELQTIYFWASAKSPNDPSSDEEFKESLGKFFETEDVPMIEAVQKRMGTEEFWDLHPAILANDKSGVLARRIIAKKIREENGEDGYQAS